MEEFKESAAENYVRCDLCWRPHEDCIAGEAFLCAVHLEAWCDGPDETLDEFYARYEVTK